MARDTWVDRLRFARMATMTIIRTLAPPMDFTGRATLSAACSSAQAPGITAIMDGDITGVLTMAVGTTAVGTTAGAAGAMAIGVATEAGTTAMDSPAGEASTVVMEASTAVAGSTAVEVADSTVATAVAGN
jgi:hypothetical protein